MAVGKFFKGIESIEIAFFHGHSLKKHSIVEIKSSRWLAQSRSLSHSVFPTIISVVFLFSIDLCNFYFFPSFFPSLSPDFTPTPLSSSPLSLEASEKSERSGGVV